MDQRKKIHPHKFTLWVAIASILMMFAGLTSAYIVKRNQVNWFSFDLPKTFWYSTVIILCSSISIWMAQKKFKNREMAAYRKQITVTMVLGLVFMLLQVLGFIELANAGLTLQKNVSISFLYVIVSLHALHVLGGVVALIVMFIKTYSKASKNYDSIPVEVMATYWHFVDFLWIYLLVFLIMIK